MAKKKKKGLQVVGNIDFKDERNGLKVVGKVDFDDNNNITNKTAFIQQQDIAPVKQTGFFNDAKGSTLQKIGNTAVDATGNILKGGLSAFEGIADFGRYRGADVLDLFGADKKAKKVRENAKANTTEEIFSSIDHILSGDLAGKVNENDLAAFKDIKEGSYLGDKGSQVFQGVGNSATNAALSALGGNVGGMTSLFMSAAGNAQSEAYQEGATDFQAGIYGALSGSVEAATEMMFGGLGKITQNLGFGTGALDDQLINRFTRKLSNTIAKNAVDLGLRSAGEGVEEVVAGFGNAILQKLIYMQDEDFSKLLKDQKLMDSFVSGALSSALMQAPTTLNATMQGRESSTGFTENEREVYNRELENRLKAEEKLTKRRRTQIEEQLNQDFERGYVNAQNIRDILGDRIDLQKDTRLAESFNEEARRTQAYENDVSKYDEKQAKVIQTAIDSGLLNNSNKTHDMVDLIAKLSADKGVDFDFTNNERIKDSGFAIDGRQVNGFVKDGTVNLNLESNQVLNKTVGHEITHVLEGTELYDNLQQSLKAYIGEKEWNNRISQLEKVYKDVKGANIENELTSDLVGEHIFNDENFIRNLSTKNPNLFQKIFDEIKYMVKIATAGSKEARDLEKVKRAFEKAYRETSKTQEGTQYSVENQTPVEMNINDLMYQSEDYGKYIEENDKGRIDIFKKVLQNKADDDYYGFKYEDISAPIVVRNEKVDGKYRVYDGQHRLAAYKQLGYDTVPVVFKEGTRVKQNVENQPKYSLTEDNQDEKYQSILTNKKEMNLGSYQEGLSKTDKSYRYNKVNSYDIKNGGRGDNVQVAVTKNGYIANNALLSDNIKGKGEGTKIMLDLNQQSLEETRSLPEYNIVGIKNHTAEGQGLWDSLVRKGFAVKNNDNTYTMLETAPTVEEYVKQRENNTNPTSNTDIRYSLSEAPKQDNQGRELTIQQQEFYKNVSPEVRDENGNLMRFYHGSNSEFTIFDLTKGSQSNSNAGVGFWFTPSMEGARNFADSVWYGDKTPTTFEVYLNMKNPKVYETYDNTEIRSNLKEQLDNTYKERKALTDKYSWETPSLTNLVSYMNYMDDAKLVESLKNNFKFKEENAKQYVEDAKKYIELNNQYKNIEKQFDDARWTDAYEQFRTDIYKIAGKSADDANTGGTGMALDNKEQVLKDYVNSLKEQGYDGIVIKNTVYDSNTMGGTNNQYVVFDPNQIKNVTNENPTDNVDIRYQLGNNEVAPTSGWNVRSEDVRLQSAFKDTIAPLQEQVQQLTDTMNRLEERIAPVEETAEKSQYPMIDKINDFLWKLQGKKDKYYGLVKPDFITEIANEERQQRIDAINNLIDNLSKKIDDSNNELNINDVKDQLTTEINNYIDEYRPLTEQEGEQLAEEYANRDISKELAPVSENLTEKENQRLAVLDLLERNNMLDEEHQYERDQLLEKANPTIPNEEATPGKALEDIRDSISI